MLKKEIYYKQFTRDYAEKHLAKSKGTQYVCPWCASGTKAHGTGAFTLYEDGFCCHSCNKSGDLLDLIGYVEGIPDHRDRLARAEELYGPIDDQSEVTWENIEQKSVDSAEEAVDYSEYFFEMHAYIHQTDYWKKRGLSEATVNRFNLGYDSNWKHPNKQGSDDIPPTPRLIIPCGKESYLARDTRPNVEKGTKLRVGKTTIFNEEALYAAKTCVWIVEGEIDAMSIVEVGGEAVAIGSTSRAKNFVERIKNQRPTAHLVLWFDTDAAGQRCTEIISEGLTALNVPFTIMNGFSGCKDANEALCKNKEDFCKMVKDIEKKIEETEEREVDVIDEREENKREYLETSNKFYLEELLSKKEKPFLVKTEFEKLNEALGGGIYEGLYIIGGITSVGKTTLVMNMIDSVAKAGKTILYVSLEMSREEIVAKSVSRHTLLSSINFLKNPSCAKTMQEVRFYSSSEDHSEMENNVMSHAVAEYGSYANNIFTIENNDHIDANLIYAMVKNHISLTGDKPIVVVDYMQILACMTSSHRVIQTEKMHMDQSVAALKRISRDFEIPVLALSSFGRSAYRGPAELDSYKESGSLEYSADVLLALQFPKGVIAETEREKDVRSVEVSILKNRNGGVGKKIPFKYYAKYNYFKEN